ncbi:hypothetical protein GYMLUDRAFT_244834 [Collybiopsis luxurians FD-317 M1]|uniref:Uncharacterized protein n=1 Tax=Collybiopsis luxurians FD-317 M1 TaxID=944289 RepID=A0A0D0BWS3_9AGAR|nr:hypothetical protein GYMLUDRAFT_244834 [Collybiopsis luxurians FD-317 M1]
MSQNGGQQLPEPSMFIDSLCRNLGLGPLQNAELQRVAIIGQSLETPNTLLHIATHARIFNLLQNSIDILIAKTEGASSTLSELNEQVGKKWSLNVEQKKTLTEIVKKFIADPLHSSYAKIAEKVEAMILHL